MAVPKVANFGYDTSRMTPTDIIKTVFGFDSFRGEQESIIRAALAGRSTLVLMPTGMGKSVCFQIPARLLKGTTFVLSPLIALMKDQVDQALSKGFRVTAINSSLSREERMQRYRKLARGEYELVYVTPERFQVPEFLDSIKSLNSGVPLLAIDEAHCISEWGHDFRPDYTRIKEIRQSLGNPPIMALTATATQEVQEDIIQQCGLAHGDVDTFLHGLERDNIALSVESVCGTEEKVRHIFSLHHHVPGAKIVYVSLIQTLEKLAHELDRLGLEFTVYHGDLAAHMRKKNQSDFLGGSKDLILATPAFGLGIDKPDIRMVVHAEVPGSLESYYQEVGRSGRDGKAAQGILLFDEDDVSIQMDFIKWANPDPEFIKTVYRITQKNAVRLQTEGVEFLREQMNFYNRRDFRVETALNLLERWGALRFEDNRWQALQEPAGDWLSQEHFEKRLRSRNKKLLDMVQYSKSDGCRSQIILNYFGLNDAPECKRCDNCVGERKMDPKKESPL